MRNRPSASRGDSPGPIACGACELNEVCRLCGLIAREGGLAGRATGTLRALQPGEPLFRSSDPAAGLFAVREGLLKRVHVSAEGDETPLGLATPGEVLGLECFSSGTHASDAIAVRPSVCCELPLPMLEQQGRRVHELAAALITLLSRAHAPAPEQARGSIRSRITRFLLDMSLRLQRRGLDGRRFSLGLSRQEIADLLDTRIETVSRMLQQLHREGEIHLRGSQVTLLGLGEALERTTSEPGPTPH